MRKLRIRVITAGGQSNGIITVWGSDVQYAMKNEFQWAGHLRPVTNIHIVRDHLVTASTHEGLIKVWDTLNYKITQVFFMY
jgi:WD40 repeat protein